MIWLTATHALAYEVWMSTAGATKDAALYPEQWSTVAPQIKGMNDSRAKPDVGVTPTEDQWKIIYDQFTNLEGAFVPMARSYFGPLVHPGVTLEQAVDSRFDVEATYGYKVQNIMIYNNSVGGVGCTWTSEEIQQMRDYLDATGHADVGILWNARANTAANRDRLRETTIAGVLIEGAGDRWFTNDGDRQGLLKWLCSDPAVTNKPVIFQVPNDGNGYAGMRHLLQWLGSTFMDYEFMRSSRYTFMPITYGSMVFQPELTSPTHYADTITGATLSMIEQRDLFEGRLAVMPTVADAYSFYRNNEPFFGALPDQYVALGTTTVTIPFSVNDLETSAAALTVGGSSSNTVFVPNSALVFGGGGAARTLTVTLNPALTGSTTINLSASDGILTGSASFQLIIGSAPSITAVATGLINSSNTWAHAAPVDGDANRWLTGNKTLSLSTNAETFYGQTLVVETGGKIQPNIVEATLRLNRLVLNGGTITTTSSKGLMIDLSGDQCILNSGILKSGGTSSLSNKCVRFTNGFLAGSGTININGVDNSGTTIEFQPTIDTTGFDGTFDVSSYGILDLPPVGTATFGMSLSGTGKYVNDAKVYLTSLVIDGTSIAPGTYTYANFTTAQKVFILNGGGTITVSSGNTPPTLTQLSNLTRDEDAVVTRSPVVADAETAAGNLVLSGYSSDQTLVRNENIVFSGTSSNRTIKLTPETNQYGTVTITYFVSDGYASTTRSFNYTIRPINDTPTITDPLNRKTHPGYTLTVPFAISDVETPLAALDLVITSSNQAIVPNSGFALSGSGADRILTFTTAPATIGNTTITLVVSDGALSATNSFLLTVSPYVAVTAVANGSINDPATWGGVLPVAGDTTNWLSGTRTISLPSDSVTFHGDVFEIQTGGTFNPGVPSAVFNLNNMVLNGGSIVFNNSASIIFDFGGDQCTFNSGTIKSGTSDGRNVKFRDGALLGSGSINITSMDTSGAYFSFVEIESTMNTVAFTGTFNVNTYGMLNLGEILHNSASFGVRVTGTGRYYINADVALTSLVLGTDTIPPGTYVYEDFTAYQKTFLIESDFGGSITVVGDNTAPVLANITDKTVDELATLSFTATATDADVPAQTLTFSLDAGAPAGAGITSGGLFSWTPTEAQGPGSYSATVLVSDGEASDSQSFQIVVNEVNAAPQISAVADQATFINLPTAPIPFAVSDSETDAGSLVLAASSSNPALVPETHIILGGSGSNRTVKIIPAIDQTGQATITLQASDGVLVTEQSFLLTVSEPYEVVEEWNFTGGSLLSENGVPTTMLNTGNVDIPGDDQFTVTRGDGSGGAMSLTSVSPAMTAANTTTLSLSVTLKEYDFSFGNDQAFTVAFRQGTVAVALLRFDATPGVGTQINNSGSIVAGTVLNAAKSTTPLTYGLTLDFAGGSNGKGSYTYWVGTPSSDGSTWYQRAAAHTGDIDLSMVAIDNAQLRIANHAAGDFFTLDQIQVSRHIKMPMSYGLWIDLHPGLGTQTNRTDNMDGDALNNLYEYGLGGNPSVVDNELLPTYRVSNAGGTSYFEYAHRMRHAEAGVSYRVEVSDSLTVPDWTTTGVELVGVEVLDADFSVATNRVSTALKNDQFIRLIIE